MPNLTGALILHFFMDCCMYNWMSNLKNERLVPVFSHVPLFFRVEYFISCLASCKQIKLLALSCHCHAEMHLCYLPIEGICDCEGNFQHLTAENIWIGWLCAFVKIAEYCRIISLNLFVLRSRDFPMFLPWDRLVTCKCSQPSWDKLDWWSVAIEIF